VPGSSLRRWIAQIGLVGPAGLLLCLLAFGCADSDTPPADFSAPELAGGDLVVAEVSGEPITAGELYHKIRLQYPQMPQEGASLGRQVEEIAKAGAVERCLIRYARERGIDRDPDVLRMMALSRSYILSVNAEEVILAEASPTEEEIRIYYEEHVDQFTVPAQIWYRQILVERESAARDLAGQLRAGADFAELAKAHSVDSRSGPHGGRMPGYQPAGRPTLPNEHPALGEALQALEPMAVSDPIRTELGWHILRVEAQRPEYAKPLAEVYDGIQEKIGGSRQAEHYSNVIDSLKQAYGVKFFESALKRFYYLQMNDEELFESAQSGPDPQQRITLYEEIVSRFPEGDRKAEALFMIGFEYAESLNDRARAREAFERFLAQHPGHELAESARTMLATFSGEHAPAEVAPSSEQPSTGP